MNSQNTKFNKELEDLRSRMNLMTKAEFEIELNSIRERIRNYIIKGIEIEYEEINIINSVKNIIKTTENL